MFRADAGVCETSTDIVFYSQLKNFFEGDDRILTTYWVALVAANVVVGSEENPNRVIRGCNASVNRTMSRIISVAHRHAVWQESAGEQPRTCLTR